MNTTPIIETLNKIDQPVSLSGWIHSIRDMGKIAFLEVRDHTGLIQVVVDDPSKMPKMGVEYVVTVSGTVRKRGERYVNAKLATGTVELGADSITVLNTSAELPFEVKKDTADVNEELRLKYRYLDLRSDRMARNLKLRHQVIKFMRAALDEQGFTEVETPMLTKGTPEGAREFLVPSRLHAEKFYVLPQSPQQFKQLLMVAGVGKYYQIARCMRDEDQRGDRQPEFTQLDLEMSFVQQEDVLNLIEKIMIGLVKTVTPHLKLSLAPFPRMTYADAIKNYDSDKPDIRKNPKDKSELAFLWVTDFPMFEKNKETGKPDAMHHPFTSPTEKDPEKLKAMDPFAVMSDAYDLVLNGYEVGGGSIRISNANLQKTVFEILGLSEEEITSRFGHMIEAFKYGVPPHGGIAPGLDRLIMILAGEPNIREVMAFPKTGDARDPLTGAPTIIPATRLSDAHITTVPPAV